MKQFKVLALSLTAMMLLSATAEAVTVGYQGRHFQATSGRGGYPPLATPCCNINGTVFTTTTTPANATNMAVLTEGVPGTFDTRTTGYITTMDLPTTGLFPAGNPYFNEMPFGQFTLIGEATTSNGDLTLAGGYGASSILSPSLPPTWLVFVQTRSTHYQTADFAVGQGPGNFDYRMSDNAYTRMGVGTITNMNTITTSLNGTTVTTTTGGTTPTTVNYIMEGKAIGTAGTRQFGGSLDVVGQSINYIGIQDPGLVREILIPVPYGPGTPLSNVPAGVVVNRSVTDSNVKVHLNTFFGTTVANIDGPVIGDFLPWTTGTITLKNATWVTPILSPLEYGERTDSGADNRTTTSYLNGNLQLVTGWLQSSYTGGNPLTPSSSLFTRVLNAEFVPEPGSLTLIGSGVLGLLGFSLASRRRN